MEKYESSNASVAVNSSITQQVAVVGVAAAVMAGLSLMVSRLVT